MGILGQAICNNFAPLLFLTFSGEFDLTLDKIRYRISIIAAHVFAATGLIGLTGSIGISGINTGRNVAFEREKVGEI